jgi:hypothetical protein
MDSAMQKCGLKTIGKIEQQQPTIFYVLREWKNSVAKSSYNTTRVGSSFN